MRILLAVDGSLHSRRAADLLGRVAPGRHQVTVLNVTPPPTPAPEKGLQSITEALKGSAEKMTASIASEVGRGRPSPARSSVVESMDVAGAILDRAAREKSDLIVLGARGLSPFKAFFLGSVSQKVLGHAKVPVLIARGGRPGKSLSVLAAVDDSQACRRSLAHLKALGPARGTRISLVHAVSNPLFGWVPGPYGMATDPYVPATAAKESLAALRRRGRRVLARAGKDFAAWRPRVQTFMPEGSPADEIIKAARARSADLIVIGRRGLSGLDRFLLGSVSQKVSAYGGCSVLVGR